MKCAGFSISAAAKKLAERALQVFFGTILRK